MSEIAFGAPEAFQLAEALIKKPLVWSRSVPTSSDTPVLTFVKFRSFVRAVKQYRSFVQLAKSGQWEDALVLARSLYELNLNLSEISCSPDPEHAARRFVKFGKFQHARLEQKRLEDALHDEDAKVQRSPKVINRCEQQLATAVSALKRDFPEFRKPSGKGWLESWSGLTVEELAPRLAEKTGAQLGESDYYVFKLGSLFTHNAPGALFLGLPQDQEVADWKKYCAALDEKGRDGVQQFLYEASICFLDIVGIAGGSIVGYQKRWFDNVAIPLLKKF